MQKQIIPTTANPVITFTGTGDVRVQGGDRAEVYVESKGDLNVQSAPDGAWVRIHATDDVSARVPAQARLNLPQVAGDLRLKDLPAPLEAPRVGGDVVLRQTGPVTLGHVGGDVSAKKVDGGLTLNFVGGDVSVRGVNGPLTLTKAGGDVSARDLNGPVTLDAGGDVRLNLNPAPGLAYTCRAGGDLTARIAVGASATILAECLGELLVDIPGAQRAEEADHTRITLKEGTAHITLKAGGDMALSDATFDDGGADFTDRFTSDIGARLEESLRAGLRGMEAGGLGLRFAPGPEEIDRITAEAQRAAEHAASAARHAEERLEAIRRKAEAKTEAANRRAERVAEREARRTRQFRFGLSFDPPRPPRPPVPPAPPTPPTPPAPPVSEQERLAVLKMLQQGKITVQQAEILLAALEGK